MFAIAFDLDTKRLDNHYPGGTSRNAYADIARVFARFGFHRMQGSLYFGAAEHVSTVQAVLAVQEVCKLHSWFRNVVRDIRVMRIEDNNDLMPVVGPMRLPLIEAAE